MGGGLVAAAFGLPVAVGLGQAPVAGVGAQPSGSPGDGRWRGAGGEGESGGVGAVGGDEAAGGLVGGEPVQVPAVRYGPMWGARCRASAGLTVKIILLRPHRACRDRRRRAEVTRAPGMQSRLVPCIHGPGSHRGPGPP